MHVVLASSSQSAYRNSPSVMLVSQCQSAFYKLIQPRTMIEPQITIKHMTLAHVVDTLVVVFHSGDTDRIQTAG